MQCYSDLIPPSGVTHALSLPFTSAHADNLIIARTSLLQLFQCKSAHAGQDTKLVLVAEYNLAGTVTSLGRVKVTDSKAGGDALLIALRDAKLSLVEWDPELHSISTLSIHYYEHDDLQAAPWQPDLADCVSRLTIDPSSRCAAFNFGISNLAIIPFHQAGDDLAMDDLDDEHNDKTQTSPQQEGQAGDAHSKYSPSFVLPLTILDPGLLHPVDMAFLHEYRDPTIGILYSTAARSSNMSPERQDVTIYAVYALDLEQKASTTLQAVQKLPNDLYRIVPLPLPVGGALLIGGNELIHVDQGGKSSSIAVNEFAKEASSFPMTDQSEARLRLEGCQIEHLGNAAGDMLVILKSGELALLGFRMDGRSVSGLTLRKLGTAHVHNLVEGSASCTANLGTNCLFIGSEEADSVLLGADKKPAQLKRTRSRAQIQPNGVESDEEEEDALDDDDDDDLYGEAIQKPNGNASSESSGQNFRVMDRLPSIAPINDLALGALGKRKRDESDNSALSGNHSSEIMVAYGRGRAGGVASITRHLEPETTKRVRYEDAIGIWCLGSTQKSQDYKPAEELVIVSHMTADGVGRSSLYRLNDGDMSPIADSDFDQAAGSAISVFKLQATNHTIQVLPTEIRVYDANFGLSQIFPVVDEEEGQLARATKAAFAEPYLALVKDDGTMAVLKADKAGELDEVDHATAFKDKTILSVSLYHDAGDFFQTSRLFGGAATSAGPILALMASDGHFCLLSLPNLRLQVFQCDSLPFLPTHLLQNTQLPKHWRNKDELAETLLVDLGNKNDKRPYLVVRSTTNDLVIYEPFAVPNVVGSFKFKKIATKPAEAPEDTVEEEGEESSLQPMQVIRDIAGHASVFVPGAQPMLILREASTMPHVYELKPQNIKSLSAINTGASPHAFVFIDDTDYLCFCQLPETLMLGHSDWVIDRVALNEDITSLAYFSPTDSYILATNSSTEFQLPQDDEWHPEWQAESTTFLPTTLTSTLKLLSSRSHRIISQFHFDASERVLCVKSINLEVSEETHERKDLIVVGTAVVKGENITTRGNIYLFDVVDVVPEPDIPETDLKLKLITKEEVRGAVSAISGVGSQGFLLAAQGQKCMVRGLKEDMSILPVAFLDMRYYVHVAKELPGTGLCILGDAFSGLWLVGYSEEPYKLQILGRDFENPAVLEAEFLPAAKQLYIVSAGEDGVLRILQYDPEDPKTERGAKLLLRSTFHTGDMPTSMTLVPPRPSAAAARAAQRSTTTTATAAVPSSSMDLLDAPSSQAHTILMTGATGSLSLLTPLSEPTYRRLSTLQNVLLSSALDSHAHYAALNPRAYRQIETDGIGGRAVIDGDLVRRWWELSTQGRASASDKAGGSVWDVRGDLAIVGGGEAGF
ncbi:Protein CFT1 [Cladophialophora carrionii]|uniref:Protein CFT1 n=1 Tax=Cladophialophora carrionii TaxID=86049 RepID=A0A1C1CS23_9EURO|nr:Protein CFT1 [Cladophialophora carrionii]